MSIEKKPFMSHFKVQSVRQCLTTIHSCYRVECLSLMKDSPKTRSTGRSSPMSLLSGVKGGEGVRIPDHPLFPNVWLLTLFHVRCDITYPRLLIPWGRTPFLLSFPSFVECLLCLHPFSRQVRLSCRIRYRVSTPLPGGWNPSSHRPRVLRTFLPLDTGLPVLPLPTST